MNYKVFDVVYNPVYGYCTIVHMDHSGTLLKIQLRVNGSKTVWVTYQDIFQSESAYQMDKIDRLIRKMEDNLSEMKKWRNLFGK